MTKTQPQATLDRKASVTFLLCFVSLCQVLLYWLSWRLLNRLQPLEWWLWHFYYYAECHYA